MSNQTLQVDDNLYQYLAEVSLREPEVLQRLRAETAELPERSMQIAPEQGQFMTLVLKLMGAQRCIEVGVFTGYSSLATALAMGENGYLLACDVSEVWTNVARRYWQEADVARRIDLRLAPALDTLDAVIAQGQTGTFDFAFIDADKETYIDYYERCLLLLKAGGLLAVDNVLWSGRVAKPDINDAETQAIRRFNDHLRDDRRVDISLVPIADGLTLARKI